MFPTTVWTTIKKAGESDPDSLDHFASRYRQPVLRFIQSRGYAAADAEDLCQDVFARILTGGVLEKADAARGRFRGLILTIAVRVIQDRRRKKTETPVEDPEEPIEDRDPDFDQGWVLYLAERAMRRLRESGSPYFEVLRGHLEGEPQARNRLWIARKKLSALIRDEVRFTCVGEEQFEDEMAYLARYLRNED
jgi:RNA polymerase sigma factor (sigma-70 family)